jgi:hypothetical protein
VSGNNAVETAFTGNVLTVTAGETAASLTVRVSSTVDPGKSDTATVTVTRGEADNTATLMVTGQSGFMDKGGTRTFSVRPRQEVTWTVEGGSEGGGTGINGNGKLSIGANEANITLIVRAETAAGAWGTAEVKVRGWQELTQNLTEIIGDTSSILGGSICAMAYGVVDDIGGSHGRWVAGAMHSAGVPVIAYSDDNGETWTEVHNFTKFAGEYQFTSGEQIRSLIYDGPEGDKKFLLGASGGNIYWSYDGITWTKDVNVFNFPFSRNQSLSVLAYGEVDVDGVPTGMYIAPGITEEYVYTTDTRWAVGGKRWNVVPMLKSMTLRGEPAVTTSTAMHNIHYGTGMVGGSRRGMFFARRIAVIRPPHNAANQETDMYLYSTDGISWELLATEIIDIGGSWKSPVDEARLAALAFQPAPPAGGYARVYDYIPHIDTKGETPFAEVEFAITGGGYIMASDGGLRLAMAHEGAYAVTE